MKSDINLISTNQAELINQSRSVRIFRLIAIASVCIVGISSVILFLIIQSISPSEIRKQQSALRASLAASRTKEAKIILVGRKIKDIKNIISERPRYDSLVSEINDIIPENVSLVSLGVNDNKVELVANSGSLLYLNELLNNLLGMVKAEKKKEIRIFHGFHQPGWEIIRYQ